MPPLAAQEYLANVAQGVAATVELADQLDPTYGFFIEETLTGGAFTGGFDESEHDVVLQHLPGDTCLFSRRPYTQQRVFLRSFVQGLPPLIIQTFFTQTDRFCDTLSLRATALRLRGNLKNEIASSFAKLTPRNDIQQASSRNRSV